ncbi:FtsX-like permease family protein [Yoonia sp.]|uniref:cell division protein FtsX n=1 Tax=Yoonia sp. TaxID=2212373 RepID=UPI001A06DCE3|nr:FtsX-like permease family protein [Yoonia sp.]MBE0414444.1 cell division protein FtsX [Yoonia sp.]
MGDPQADRAVPPSGITARLTVFVAAVMAFLAVLALALSLSAGRVAERWVSELAQAATLRLPASEDQADALLRAALHVLETTPGVASARALSADEQAALLAPWFGAALPLDTLPVPQLVEVIADAGGYDPEGLQARLAAEVPGAVLDDHTSWRAPLIAAADRLRLIGWLVVVSIFAAMAAMITLAAHASLAANAQVIRVLRLVGARDIYIARGFVRRFTLRAGAGAVAGVVAGLIAVMLLPRGDVAGGFITGLGFAGAGWLWPLVIPPLAAIVAFFATRAAALRRLRTET